MIDPIKSIEYSDGKLRFIDQRLLPGELAYIATGDYRQIIAAIKSLAIRGAPAIGIAAGFAVALAVDRLPEKVSLTEALAEIADSRPTAVNLGWAVERQRKIIKSVTTSGEPKLKELLLGEARKIHEEDQEMCLRIGAAGADLLPQAGAVLTICNTGALATGGIGTALGAIYTAVEQGKNIEVYACETRPALQGARLTVWELQRAGIPVTLLVDSAAGILLKSGKIDCVIVGADRIARNGDTANKIGAYPLATMAARHDVPFYVAAPESTFDRNLEAIDDDLVELRGAEEIVGVSGSQSSPAGTRVFAPAFDITPRELISAYITDQGVHRGGRQQGSGDG